MQSGQAAQPEPGYESQKCRGELSSAMDGEAELGGDDNDLIVTG